MPFPIEFPKCPSCGSKHTISRLACADEPSITKGTFTSLERYFTAFQDISKVMGLMIKGILCHYDVCATCGLRYCTRAEITSIPATTAYQPGSLDRNIRDLK